MMDTQETPTPPFGTTPIRITTRIRLLRHSRPVTGL
jgi:hypothetical protein